MFITQMRFLFIYIFTYIYSYTYIYFFIFIHLAGILILWYFQGISGFSLHVKWEPVPRNRAITFRFLFFQKDDLAQIYPEKKKGQEGFRKKTAGFPKNRTWKTPHPKREQFAICNKSMRF